MFIFDLASQHGQWLAARQAAAASNIANINTPGYRAIGVAPFEKVLERTGLDMAMTHGGHMQPQGASFQPLEMEREAGWDTNHSGNNVTLEAELLKIGENGRMLALDSGLTRMFHRMLLASLKVA